MYSYLRPEMFMRAFMESIDFPQIVFWLFVVSVVLSTALAITGIAWAVNSMVEEPVGIDRRWPNQPLPKKKPHFWTPVHHT